MRKAPGVECLPLVRARSARRTTLGGAQACELEAATAVPRKRLGRQSVRAWMLRENLRHFPFAASPRNTSIHACVILPSLQPKAHIQGDLLGETTTR